GNDKFVKTKVILPGVFKASHDWADYDGDGDLDLLLTGSDGTFPSTRVMENQGNGTFVDAEIGLVDVFDGTGEWVDFDADGDLDVVITGHAFAGVVAKIFVNTGNGSFFELASPFPGVRISSTSWGDFDADGDLDVAIAGWDGIERITKVFENTGSGTFVETFTNMVGISVGSVDWADADGDGDLDLLVAGASADVPVTNVYLYDSSLGSGKGDSNKRTTSSEAVAGSSELPLAVDGFLFKQSYPNPFATQTTVHFAVGKSQYVRITLYNMIGQVVKTPYEGAVRPNEMMTVRLDAAGIASGAYFLRMEGESLADTQTVIVNK
ncbi:MAG: FG-GAP-like repeat-containing protein, partial [Rhodothermia bacterium]